MNPRRVLLIGFPLDLELTLGPLRHGLSDPTIRLGRNEVWRATRTPVGPACLHVEVDGERVVASAWGPGAEWSLDGVPDLLGVQDKPQSFRPDHPRLIDLHRRLRGLRIGRTKAVMESLLPAILEQKVTSHEAFKSYRALVYRFGERAPGPARLWLQPEPAILAQQPYFEFHPLGIERRRAEVIRAVAARAVRLEEIVSLTLAEAYARLTAFHGVGPWTAAEVAARALGDTDAVSVGDFHLPHVVAWVLAGERRADDARMLELLEPYRGHRGRAIRLIEAGAERPGRRAPRARVRRIASI